VTDLVKNLLFVIDDAPYGNERPYNAHAWP
jgi:hypothetical protein